MESIIKELKELIMKFEEHDKNLIKCYSKDNSNDTFLKIHCIRVRILEILGQHLVLQIEDHDLVEKANNIRYLKKYNLFTNIDILLEYVKVFSQPENEQNQNDLLTKYLGKDYWRLDFLDGYDERRKELGSIIVTEPIPNDIIKHFNSICNCYCVCEFEAAIVFCRALIEATLYDFLMRIDKYSIKPDMLSLKVMINDSKSYFYNSDIVLFDRVCIKNDGVKQTAERIIHYDRRIKTTKQNNEGLSASKVLSHILNTVKFVEMVYEVLNKKETNK